MTIKDMIIAAQAKQINERNAKVAEYVIPEFILEQF